jgi:hypothetical protein
VHSKAYALALICGIERWTICRGYGPNSNDTVAAITAEVDAGTVDFVLHPGDVSYADGYMWHWDTFFRKIQVRSIDRSALLGNVNTTGALFYSFFAAHCISRALHDFARES